MKKTVIISFATALLFSCTSTKNYVRSTEKIQYVHKIDSLKSEIARLKMKNTTDSLRILLEFYKNKTPKPSFEKIKAILPEQSTAKVEENQIKAPYKKVFEKPNKTGTFKDERDGQTYKWVKIGKQTWMAQNLNFLTHSDCWSYNNDISNRDKYGLLYNFDQIDNACPKGWHVPTEKEWEELENTISSGSHNLMNGSGDGYNAECLLDGNDSGFNILFGGMHRPGRCVDLGQKAWFWTVTRINNPIHVRIVDRSTGKIRPSELGSAYGLSLRCVKNDE